MFHDHSLNLRHVNMVSAIQRAREPAAKPSFFHNRALCMSRTRPYGCR